MLLNNLYIMGLGLDVPYYAFQNSDIIGKGIVVLLFVSSIVVWIIMAEKWLELGKIYTTSMNFYTYFQGIKHPLKAHSKAKSDPSPIARICETGVDLLLSRYKLSKDMIPQDGIFRGRKLTEAEIDAIRSAMEQTVSNLIMEIEKNINYLSIAVSVSPFCGLFGTVWGVMAAFCGVAQQGSANISALAPGVSGALLTTVVGLVVAIPSLIGYNILTSKILKITVHLDSFVDEFMAKVKLEQLD